MVFGIVVAVLVFGVTLTRLSIFECIVSKISGDQKNCLVWKVVEKAVCIMLNKKAVLVVASREIT